MSDLVRGIDTYANDPEEYDASEQKLVPSCDECSEQVRSSAGNGICISCVVEQNDGGDSE